MANVTVTIPGGVRTRLPQRRRSTTKKIPLVRTAGDRTTVGTLLPCYEPVPGPMLVLRARQPETKPRSCGNQSAHESMFNRRLRVLSPAVRSSEPALPATAETNNCVRTLEREHERQAVCEKGVGERRCIASRSVSLGNQTRARAASALSTNQGSTTYPASPGIGRSLYPIEPTPKRTD